MVPAALPRLGKEKGPNPAIPGGLLWREPGEPGWLGAELPAAPCHPQGPPASRSPGSAPRTRFLPRLHRSDSFHATKQALSKEATLLPGFSPQAVGVGECDGANQAARCQTPRHGSRQRVFGELGWPQLLVLVSCCGPSQHGAWI